MGGFLGPPLGGGRRGPAMVEIAPAASLAGGLAPKCGGKLTNLYLNCCPNMPTFTLLIKTSPLVTGSPAALVAETITGIRVLNVIGVVVTFKPASRRVKDKRISLYLGALNVSGRSVCSK